MKRDKTQDRLRWVQKTRAAGLCLRCGTNPRTTANHCEDCRKIHNAIVLKRKARNKEKSPTIPPVSIDQYLENCKGTI